MGTTKEGIGKKSERGLNVPCLACERGDFLGDWTMRGNQADRQAYAGSCAKREDGDRFDYPADDPAGWNSSFRGRLGNCRSGMYRYRVECGGNCPQVSSKCETAAAEIQPPMSYICEAALPKLSMALAARRWTRRQTVQISRRFLRHHPGKDYFSETCSICVLYIYCIR